LPRCGRAGSGATGTPRYGDGWGSISASGWVDTAGRTPENGAHCGALFEVLFEVLSPSESFCNSFELVAGMASHSAVEVVGSTAEG
jgi:hypothetical protein